MFFVIRILFFIESLQGGGAEKVLRDLVNAMDPERFAITVQTLYPEEAGALLAPGIRYRYCYPAADRFQVARMRAEAALGLTYPLHIRDDYDIEVAYLECGSTKIMAGSTNRRALKLAWVHCDFRKRFADAEGFAAATRRCYAAYDHVICVSEAVRQSFTALYGDAPHSLVLHNTINDADILRRAAGPLPEDVKKRKCTLVAVGRLSAPKHYLRALDAHRRLLADGLDHELWIVGDGEERPQLEAYIRENRLETSARLLGFRADPYSLMQAADLLLCSSIYEGFSTFVTEGLILGKPIVTTDVSGMRELLGDSQYGLITENDDDAFYRGLRRMLTEPGLSDHYARQAGIRGRDFRQETLVRETEHFLEKALQRKRNT